MKKASVVLLLMLTCFVGKSQWVWCSSAGEMVENRTNHRVYGFISNSVPHEAIACGGRDGSTVLATTEFLTPIGSSGLGWQAGPSMSTPRMDFELIGSFNFLIAAGGNNGVDSLHLSSTELYDSGTETWSPGPDLSVGRSLLRATLLFNGKVLFTGGFDGVNEVATVDLYDPETNTMISLAPMNMARSSHTAMSMSDGQVMVTGGFNAEYGGQLDHCEIYNPTTNTWAVIAPLNTARENHAIAHSMFGYSVPLVTGGRVFDAQLGHYVALAEAEVYNGDLDVWETFALPSAMSFHHMFWYQNELLAVSGANHTGEEVETTYDLPLIIGLSNQWTDITVPSEPAFSYKNRHLSAACLISYGWASESDVLVCGVDEDGIGTSEIWEIETSRVNEIQPARNGLFPNPAVDRMRITGERFERWEVIDANGKIVSTGNEWYVEVAHLAAGRYNLAVYNEGTANAYGFVKVSR